LAESAPGELAVSPTAPAAATPELASLMYDELRALASRCMGAERRDHTLQPTALIHEAFMRLVDQTRVQWQDRTQFLAVAAEMMRRILIDHARAHQAQKRGGDWQRTTITDGVALTAGPQLDLLDLDDALGRLAALNARHARIVELRFFAGLSMEEVAATLGLSPATIYDDWAVARAWLRRELSRGGEAP